VGYYNTGDRMKYWARWCFWGGFWGSIRFALFVILVGPILALDRWCMDCGQGWKGSGGRRWVHWSWLFQHRNSKEALCSTRQAPVGSILLIATGRLGSARQKTSSKHHPAITIHAVDALAHSKGDWRSNTRMVTTHYSRKLFRMCNLPNA